MLHGHHNAQWSSGIQLDEYGRKLHFCMFLKICFRNILYIYTIDLSGLELSYFFALVFMSRGSSFILLCTCCLVTDFFASLRLCDYLPRPDVLHLCLIVIPLLVCVFPSLCASLSCSPVAAFQLFPRELCS